MSDMQNRLKYFSSGKLVSWINNTCKSCHRFINNSRGAKEYCEECSKKRYRLYQALYRLAHKIK